ncbi:sialin [Parasteatoda tepidariorum]|nr:sialin [Parasteatoda tepidariorum]XP_015924059.2 sialin [Parasteatoda tepidariorum]XP_015924060.2 sialin [Parasteatoda tepidariorum]XP_042906679.1 sialin [Parasteatoda tepidariorum]XP_042906680.1 sialin [Parasteatoda tepidariorum]
MKINMDGKNFSGRKYELPGMRYIFTAVSFLGFVVNYSIRVNLNVAIVAMVNNTAVYHHSGVNHTVEHECSIEREALNQTTPVNEFRREGEFNWSPQTQGIILGAFYYGYCIFQIPGGRLAEALSGKWVFGIGNLVPALLTLLTPMAARYGVGALIAIRALEGLFQGVSCPAMHTMIGRWLPDSEKSFLTSLIYCGIATGTVAGMNIAGLFCNSDLFGGWPAAFYIIGIFGCVWFVLWCIFISDSPTSHPCITEEELDYITSNQKIEKRKIPSTPWLKILTSVPVWAIVVVQVGVDWCFYTLLSDLPTFFATVLGFEIEKNAFLSSFPHVLYAIMALSTGYTADALIRREIATVNFIRKFCTSLACLVPAAGLIGVCLARCDVTMCVIALMISVGAIGCCYSGYMLSHIDLSPEYAGTLMGIANMSSALTGFLAPLTVGILTEEDQSLRQWHTAFGITIIILIISNLVFVFFSSAQKQDWLSTDPKNNAEDMTYSSLKQDNFLNDFNSKDLQVL